MSRAACTPREASFRNFYRFFADFCLFSRFSGRGDIFRAVLQPDGTQNAMGEFGMSKDIVLRNPRYFIERIFDLF